MRVWVDPDSIEAGSRARRRKTAASEMGAEEMAARTQIVAKRVNLGVSATIVIEPVTSYAKSGQAKNPRQRKQKQSLKNESKSEPVATRKCTSPGLWWLGEGNNLWNSIHAINLTSPSRDSVASKTGYPCCILPATKHIFEKTTRYEPLC